MKKIILEDDIRSVRDRLRNEGKTIGLCHGTFDMFHIGHVRYLREARSMVDTLFVSITADEYVNKGSNRPIFKHEDRMNVISSLEFVDYVIASNYPSAMEVISLLEPDLYIKGADYKDTMTPGLLIEKDAIEEVGGKLVYAEAEVVSPIQKSEMCNAMGIVDRTTFMDKFKSSYTYEEVISIIDGCKDLKVLVISDAIIDEYVYWTPMDKAPKTCIVAGEYNGSEKMGGGGLFIANHAIEYANDVTFATRTCDEWIDFIEEVLDDRVKLKPFMCDMTPYKCRYVYRGTSGKPQVTSELCKGVRPTLSDDYRLEFTNWLVDEIDKYDVIIVADFGHGTLFNENIEVINNSKVKKIINVQSNESNIGYNLANKYVDPTYLTLDTYEAELILNRRINYDYDSMHRAIVDVTNMIGADIVAITMGREGTIMYDGSSYRVPVTTTDVLDAIGAGDVFMTLSGLVGMVKDDPILMGLIGNCAGGAKVSKIATSSIINKDLLYSYINEVMIGKR